MSDSELTYDDVLTALDDIAASDAQVQVYIAGQSRSLVAGLTGRLRRAPEGLFLDELRPVYVASGGDEDLAVFFVVGDNEVETAPCFMVCRRLFQTAFAVPQDELTEGVAAGVFWRALTIGVGGVFLNIGVQAVEEGS